MKVAEDDPRLAVLEGVECQGQVNTDDATILENIRASIRRGHPQVRPQELQDGRIALVCGGPSLSHTLNDLRNVVAEGAKIVTVNGAYAWCLAQNFIPSMQIVMDARASNARFVEPEVPRCRYVMASQCAPELWNAVEGRPHVWIYHVGVSEDSAAKRLLDSYYLQKWHGIGGGTTVGTRAIALLRVLGYLRFDIFGMDSCWMANAHHAYDQPENATDKRYTFTAHPTGHPELSRVFVCAPWHVQQAQDMLQMIRFQGQQFVFHVHGDGLIAYIMRSAAEVTMREQEGA